MIGRTLSRYRVVEELGQGGMGVVYKAEDLRLGRSVALKFLPGDVAGDRQALERFSREARAASALNHPHICTIHDIDEHDGQPFIVMELLEGRTLRDRMAAGRLPLDTVVKLAIQIAEALGAAHARGIVHRDIKPANVFVTSDGRAKVLDFGLAKLVAESDALAGAATATAIPAVTPKPFITTPGQTMGTVAYMSPEQVRGEDLDERTDIFSCGVVIYEMVTGSLPFQGATTGVLFDGILNKTPVPVTELNTGAPAELVRILDKALEKDRELRYQSIREMRADLARLERDSATGSTGAVGSLPALPPPHARGRHRVAIAVAAGTAIVAAAAAAYVVWLSPGPSVAPDVAVQTTLTRVTFDEGLQTLPTWSPDGRFIAYSSNQSGNLDIWVQPLGGGRAVQVTFDPSNDWQPAWSPDGDTLAFRSERGGGGIFVVPAFGGRERQLSSVGYWPEWSPKGATILVVNRPLLLGASRVVPHVYLLEPNGSPPRRILVDELEQFLNVGRIIWHPDGERISFQAVKASALGFWTQPIAGGPAVLAEPVDTVRREMEAQLESIALPKWSPAGDAIYFEGLTRGVWNLWRLDVDPATLRLIAGPMRLTTGPGIDGGVSVASSGDKLAFVTRAETTRLWSLPFDALRLRLTGDAVPVTAANMSVSPFDVSADGNRLVYVATRPGKQTMELWSSEFDDAQPVLLGDALSFFSPRVSRDGTRVAYRLQRDTQRPERRLAWLTIGSGQEHTMAQGLVNPLDWSLDGERILHNCPPPEQFATLCESEATSTSAADARPIVVDAAYSIWQGRYSPDGRWVLFNAQGRKEVGISILGVVPTAGGEWMPLTDPTLWADKARWSPDGRTIYFISNRDGAFFDVWGIGFDPATGASVGGEFRVTNYDNPGRTVSASSRSELTVSQTRIVVPITETTGSIWVLDGIKR
jgi:Tol biopolymer transport system component/predicted Ser/Thr protein kinase